MFIATTNKNNTEVLSLMKSNRKVSKAVESFNDEFVYINTHYLDADTCDMAILLLKDYVVFKDEI